jgi:hypothetical protein
MIWAAAGAVNFVTTKSPAPGPYRRHIAAVPVGWFACQGESCLKDLTELNKTRPTVQTGADSVARASHEERRWAGEVLRRGVFELLYLAANLGVASCVLLWLYRLLAHKPASRIGLILVIAAAISLTAYQCARWRASALMSLQFEKLTAWVIATLGIALVGGGISLAFIVGALRWFSVPGMYSWSIGGTVGLCVFLYMVAGEWRELADCLALPSVAEKTAAIDPTIA